MIQINIWLNIIYIKDNQLKKIVRKYHFLLFFIFLNYTCKILHVIRVARRYNLRATLYILTLSMLESYFILYLNLSRVVADTITCTRRLRLLLHSFKSVFTSYLSCTSSDFDIRFQIYDGARRKGTAHVAVAVQSADAIRIERITRITRIMRQ